jgi:hypothetical protein
MIRWRRLCQAFAALIAIGMLVTAGAQASVPRVVLAESFTATW